jgi:endoglucanase
MNPVWNWDSRTPAAFVLFAEIAAARPAIAASAGLDANLTGWQHEAEHYFDSITSGKVSGVSLTKGGLLYFDGDSEQASLQPAMGFAALLLRYAPIASSKDKTDAYVVSSHFLPFSSPPDRLQRQKFAQDQIDYLLGNNPMNGMFTPTPHSPTAPPPSFLTDTPVPYMVGLHPNSPKNPHSAMAAGGSNIENIRTDPPVEAHVLYGAIVGGPLKSDKFWDWRDDWAQTEVALDYNANVPALAAYQIANHASDPYYVAMAGTYTVPEGEPCDAALPCKRSGMSGSAVIGTVIGVIMGVAVIICVIIWLMRDKLRKGYGYTYK